METEIQKCLEILRSGGTILYPTDTIWGIGCDATNEKAVEKVIQVKAPTLKETVHTTPITPFRTGGKSFVVLVSDPGMLNRFVKDVPEMAWDLMDANDSVEDDEPVKPITIIYDGARGIAKSVLAEDGSIGIRMVKRSTHDFCHRLIHKFGKPIVSTSANISGEPSPQDFSEIPDEIKSKVDYVVDFRTQDSGLRIASSIIKLKANGEFVIIRE